MNTLEKHLNTLNENQKAAVLHFGSPLLIRAGAGSGKTRVITTKIAYLIEKRNVPPRSILALTFTNKAANEMKARAVSLSPLAEGAVLKTFHSFGVWFLRQYGDVAGIDKHFTIYDVEASCSLLAQIKLRISRQEKNEAKFSKTEMLDNTKESEQYEVSLTANEVKYFYEKIARAKDYCLSCNSDNLALIDGSSVFQKLYKEYQKRLEETGNVDFGDLILLPYLILKNNDDIRNKMQEKFTVIMVDEYQDTNIAQVELLKCLVGDFQYLCVVGDEDQAIYKFRGAEIRNILEFERTFEGTDTITLDKNYRSFSSILNVATSVISKNERRFKKEVKSMRGDGEKVQVVLLDNQDAEAAFALSLVLEGSKQGYAPGEWAIIYRTNRQSNTFETTFLNAGIPYVVVGGQEFYQREEIRDAIALLSLIVNGKDEVALRRIILKYVDGIGEKKCEELINLARTYVLGTEKQEDFSMIQENFQNDFLTAIPIILSRIKRMSRDGKNNLEVFISKILLLRSLINAEKIEIQHTSINEAFANTLAVFIDYAIKLIGLYSHYKEQDKKNKTDKEGNLKEFVESSSSYECNYNNFLSFMEYIELREELESKDGKKYEESVKLMSMHTTKGLEFKNVVVTGLEKGLFPRFENDINEVEEERRLMYVSCTRAMDHLFITSCRYRRSVYSSGYTSPSMFLFELDEKFIDVYEVAFGSVKKISLRTLLTNGIAKYEVNMCVEHREYGFGRVEKVREICGECSIIVHFFQTDQKKIFLPEHTKDLTIRHDIKIGNENSEYDSY